MVASTHAVYLIPSDSPKRSHRISLTTIEWLHRWVNGGGFTLSTQQGRVVRVSFHSGDRGVFEVIRDRLLCLESVTVTVTVGRDDSEREVRFSPWRSDSVGYWTATGGSESDIAAASEYLRSRVESEVWSRARAVPTDDHGSSVEWPARDHSRLVGSVIASRGDSEVTGWSVGALVSRSGQLPILGVLALSDRALYGIFTPESRAGINHTDSIVVSCMPLGDVVQFGIGEQLDSGVRLLDILARSDSGRPRETIAEAAARGGIGSATFGVESGHRQAEFLRLVSLAMRANDVDEGG